MTVVDKNPPPEVPPERVAPRTAADFQALFSAHADELHRYLSRWAPEAADDLVADVFVAAIRGRSGYDPDRAAVRPWLYGIATNLMRTHLRSRRRERAATARVQTPGHADSHENRVLDQVDAQVRARQLGKALDGLAQRDRDVLLLTGWAGLDSAEVAQALDIPVGTVRSRLHRARRHLRAACPLIDAEENGDA
ncbi:RNA polymerase sigma factor [Umezawaea tangerina]|uniref:RNA polymerase sigma-70 factor (ECF subfamily) n=1 Tax=Umezawaea tangerina TaxID=84725 RepID=A0A2T0SGQ1_9PSEU|nr:RNA polymerase sigma factor [Umezawaea tangerina]PRY32594.1 RNA polymerase sigma-70 factor (ECF subfamily) [Umezawaea tangerina]